MTVIHIWDMQIDYFYLSILSTFFKTLPLIRTIDASSWSIFTLRRAIRETKQLNQNLDITYCFSSPSQLDFILGPSGPFTPNNSLGSLLKTFKASFVTNRGKYCTGLVHDLCSSIIINFRTPYPCTIQPVWWHRIYTIVVSSRNLIALWCKIKHVTACVTVASRRPNL